MNPRASPPSSTRNETSTAISISQPIKTSRSNMSSSPISMPISSPAISSSVIASAPPSTSAQKPRPNTTSHRSPMTPSSSSAAFESKPWKLPATLRSLSLFLSTISTPAKPSPRPSSQETRCLSETSGAQIFASPSAGLPPISAAFFTTLCKQNFFHFQTPLSSTPLTAPAPFAEKLSAKKPSLPSASNAASITPSVP